MTKAAPIVTFVTPSGVAFDVVVDAAARAAARVGPGFAVQLRDKEARDDDELRSRVARLVAIAPRVVVNVGDLARGLAVVRAAGAAGVHVDGRGLARGDVARARAALGEELLVTAATHADEDVERAADEGADVVLVSPIFATPGAEKAPPRGAAALASAGAILRARGCRERVAVVALGGVSADNVAACRDAGADGVAVVRALLGAGADGAAALAAPFT